MKVVTVSGPPSSGKTAIILKAVQELKERSLSIGAVKFDCLSTDDRKLYESSGLIARTGLSGSLCPDHFFVSNIEECVAWGVDNAFDILFIESAGLCNRCSPHIQDVTAVCVIDNLMGVNTPKKIGPMLKLADIVAITKGDIVSQAEREIFALKVKQANPGGSVLHVSGITGQGACELASLLMESGEFDSLAGKSLRFSMPSALCSYCLGETRIGKEHQMGNVRKISLE
jgi:Ni2+-binding GTPase involved in maturation of urease and hydrogenase